jgi:uncharacterized protein YaaR (DUF327 family)
MKIKVTENQYNKIRIIKESEDQLAKFKQLCNEKSAELDKIYSKITFESVGDILSMNINIKNLGKVVYGIEDFMYKAKKQFMAMYGQDDVDDEIELAIYDMAEVVTDKATNLTLILDKLEDIQGYQEEFNLTAQFNNIKPLEI